MISLINAQRKLTDTEQRMIDDGDFFDVTSAQIRALCAKLFQMGYPLKEVQRIRTKYWDYFTDKEKEVMQELGLNYDEQAISKRGDTLLINGFTVRQWKMLTADDYFPPPATIQKFMNLCLTNGDTASYQILLEKYQT